jgi:hypothetical protein
VILQSAGPNFGTLQVHQDADGTVLFLCCFAQPVYVTRMFFVGTVREIQPGNIHPKAQHLPHRTFSTAGWANGADNLGSASPVFNGGTECGNREIARNEIRFSFLQPRLS